MSLLHMSCITPSSMDEELRCVFASIRDHQLLPKHFIIHQRLDDVYRIGIKKPLAVLPALPRILSAKNFKDRDKTQISLANGKCFWAGVICQRMRQFNCTLEATGECLRGLLSEVEHFSRYAVGVYGFDMEVLKQRRWWKTLKRALKWTKRKSTDQASVNKSASPLIC